MKITRKIICFRGWLEKQSPFIKWVHASSLRMIKGLTLARTATSHWFLIEWSRVLRRLGQEEDFQLYFHPKWKVFFPNREYSRVFLPSAIYPKLLFNWGGSLWICKSRLYGKMWMETYPTITTEKYVITEGVKNSLTRWFFFKYGFWFLISIYALKPSYSTGKHFFFNILICTRVWTKKFTANICDENSS